MSDQLTQLGFMLNYYKDRPNQEIANKESRAWAEREFEKLTGKRFEDSGRAIRTLHDRGCLIKVRKGVYKYDPDYIQNRETEDFPSEIKKQVLERDGYRCVVCGLGVAEGQEVQVDHIKPKDKGGKATLENGQTLCGIHNYRKKNYNQTESGKRMFIRLLELAVKNEDEETIQFCEEILKVYDIYGVNGHIEWKS